MAGIMEPSAMTRKLWEVLQKVKPEFRTKPHIRKWGGKWECIGRGCSCLGYSPKDAYDSWLHYRRLLSGASSQTPQP